MQDRRRVLELTIDADQCRLAVALRVARRNPQRHDGTRAQQATELVVLESAMNNINDFLKEQKEKIKELRRKEKDKLTSVAKVLFPDKKC